MRLAIPAIITTREGTRRVQLQDLSARGARIRGDVPYRPGEEALLQWGRFEAHGAVWWFDNGDCGISFFDPVPAADLLATRDLADSEFPLSARGLVRRTAAAYVSGRLRL